jgi:hypothetical protein
METMPTDGVYETPTVVEVGNFTELTRDIGSFHVDYTDLQG